MIRNYPKLSIEEFGRQLIESGDLDPVYISLQKLEDHDTVCKWLVAYWCCYHAGVSSYLASLPDKAFWRGLWIVAENKQPVVHSISEKWPRGVERRHWRAKNATNTVEYLQKKFNSASEAIEHLCDAAPDYKNVADRVQEWPSFGPWIAFKVCDMLERLDLVSIDFDRASVFMFDGVKDAALRLYCMRASGADWKDIESATPKRPQEAIDTVVSYLLDAFKDLTAPPLHDRLIGLQEVETVLCKWKSHMNGHYPLNNDIDEIHNVATVWGEHIDIAREFATNLPKK